MNSRFKDLSGKTVGRWTVLNLAAYGPNLRTAWLCECVCGKIKAVNAYSLNAGRSHHCGCMSKPSLTHGMTGTREYGTWQNMKNRCYNSNKPGYEYYGAVGITVCDEWKNSFEAFIRDMGKCPDGFEIDRKNGKLGYFPGNCRWVDGITQANNMKSNRWVSFNGKNLTVAQWARELKLPAYKLYHRLNTMPNKKAMSV